MSTVRTVAAVGIFTSGMQAGLTAAFQILINPLFRDGSLGLSPKDRLRVWDTAYHNGLAAMPLLALSSAILFSASAYAFGPISAGELGDYSSRKTSLVVASALQLAIVPFTIIFIKPLNKVLLDMRKRASTNAETYTAADIEPGLGRWAKLHNVRAAMSAAGFALAILCELNLFRL